MDLLGRYCCEDELLRGADVMQESMFTTVILEKYVPARHPLRPIRELFNEALKKLNGLFESIYADVSSVTDEVMAEALAWQSRPLEPMYPVVFFDALRVKIRTDGSGSNKAVYLALGIQADGQRDVLGLWIEQTEGAV